MTLAHQEHVVFEPLIAGALREHPVTIRQPAATEPPPSRRATQRADLERLRRRLTEPRELRDRDLLTLLSYAIGGDGDPIVGLLDDTRAIIGAMGDLPAGTDQDLLVSLERRLAVAIELYARATASTEP